MARYGTLSADGQTDVVQVNGPVTVHINGTWGGGTFVVQYRSADSTAAVPVFRTVDQTSSTADADILIEFPEGTPLQVRGDLSGSTSPSLFWEFIGRVISKS